MCYSGLVRKKNVLGVMMQCLYLMGLLTVIWGVYGYSLAFGGVPGESNYSPYIGNTDFLFMKGVQREWTSKTGSDGKEERSGPSAPNEGAIPRLTHMLFQ